MKYRVNHIVAIVLNVLGIKLFDMISVRSSGLTIMHTLQYTLVHMNVMQRSEFLQGFTKAEIIL